MRPRFSLLPIAVVLSLLLPLLSTTPLHAARMRPYAGIGVMLLPLSPSLVQEAYGELPLYDQPALGRLGTLSSATLPRLDWILGLAPRNVPVMVMARRGEWLRVTYDDAGREGWVRPRWRNAFETWDELFADRNVRPLPGLQERYYRLFSRPEGEPLATLASRPLFRVGMVDGDWLRVVGAQDAAGWLRWRDEDGRMLVGLEPEQGVSGER
ncbi:SH3 domain-containing protein [Pelobacter propionicus]|uniref:SH3b domain-containing protein n=1 Tax=Pelobacter propionicus (strain DSM 2379 / NBRC 103807 / OttBd1) TaxID=338966 RepID=A1ALN2_PELPD|nr:hypothetical protein [Pelobacter propionicus]ABK98252.1 conserved hypothetical protein [Pelobacter propionicus DSM 2379]